MEGRSVEVKLLGTPSLRVDGAPVRPPSRKAMALVAYLCLCGETPREKVAELLWPELGPDGARHNVRQELYRLSRSKLGPHLVVTPSTVGLKGAWQVDVSEFEALAHEGDADEALARYAGPLLDAFVVDDAEPFDVWVHAKRTRLAEARRDALSRSAATSEARGDLRGALARHLTLLDEDELQERHQREAIRLHGLLGERERAAERFERFSALLRDELGLEPLPETRREWERALAAPSPGEGAPPAPGAFSAPSLRPPLVGRGGAWLELEAAAGRLALIVGEAGVGKSRLTLAFAASFGTPIVVRSQEVARETPLYPVAEALRWASRDARAGTRLATLERVWRAEVARLVPEFDEQGAAPPTESRARFVEGLARALELAAGPGGAVVFEDVHWADASTLELLAHVTRRAAREPSAPRVFATVRAEDLGAHEPLGSALSGLKREDLVRTVTLVNFTEAEVLDLVRTLSGSGGAVLFARRLFRATSGHPLFVLETLRFLFEIGELRADANGWSSPYDDGTEDYSELPMPPEVRDAVLRRVTGVSAPARRLLDAASLAGTSFTLDELAPTVALSEWEALEELEGLVRASLLEAREDGFVFSHDLVRRALADDLTPDRRRLLHRRLAAALEAQGKAPARIAEHLEGASLTASAARWRVRAAEHAASVFAYREATRHLDAALRADPSDEQAFAWRLLRTDWWWRLDDRSARERELRALDDLAERSADAVKRAEVDARWSALFDNAGRYEDAASAAKRALARGSLPSELHAWATYLLGVACRNLGRVGEAEGHFAEVLALPDVSVERRAMALDMLAHCAAARHDLAAASRHNEAALAALRASPFTRPHAVALNTAARVAAASGDVAGALERLREALSVARRVSDAPLLKAFLTNAVQLHVHEGQLDEALERLHEGLDLVADGEDARGEGGLRHRLGDVQVLRGRLGAALRAYREAVLIADELGQRDQQTIRRLSLARLFDSIGDAASMRGVLHELDTRFPGEAAWSVDVERARLAWLEGDVGAIERLRTLLAEPVGDVKTREGALASLGRMLLEAGRPEEAAEVVGAEGSTPAARAALLAVRLGAASALGRTDAATCDAATALLTSGRVPPLEALALHAALADAGRPSSGAAIAEQLAASLPPEHRAEFLARRARFERVPS